MERSFNQISGGETEVFQMAEIHSFYLPHLLRSSPNIVPLGAMKLFVKKKKSWKVSRDNSAKWSFFIKEKKNWK